MEKLSDFSLHIIEPAIMIVVLFIGVCVTLIKFRSLGKAAIAAVLGFLLLILSVLFDVGHSVWVVYGYDINTSRDWYETVYWIKTAVRTLFAVIGFVLLVAAIVMKRPTSDTNI